MSSDFEAGEGFPLVTIAFGWDIAGWVGGRASLVRADYSNETISVTIMDEKTSLTENRDSQSALNDATLKDATTIAQLLERGSLAIDVPIDLQHLPSALGGEIDEHWTIKDLTNRKVDQYYGGFPPLCDRFGASVFRIQATLAAGGLNPKVGTSIFETYPSACLQESLGAKPRSYKGGEPEKRANLRSLIDELGWQCPNPSSITDDVFDAAICAIAAIDKEAPDLADVPKGYVISRRLVARDRKIRFLKSP